MSASPTAPIPSSVGTTQRGREVAIRSATVTDSPSSTPDSRRQRLRLLNKALPIAPVAPCGGRIQPARPSRCEQRLSTGLNVWNLRSKPAASFSRDQPDVHLHLRERRHHVLRVPP